MISAKLDGRLELSRQLGAARKVIVRDGFLVRGRPVPYHVPTHAQTAATARGSELVARLGTGETDSTAEDRGFELPVPPEEG